MKNFIRDYPLFSVCGLNCGLCTMHIGPDAYRAELDERIAMVHILLTDYNDGRHKSPFCTAVNLLELPALRRIMEELSAETMAELPPKEKARLAATKFETAAAAQGISLKLRKKK